VRPRFAALLDRIEANGVRVVFIEDASRLLASSSLKSSCLFMAERGCLTAGGKPYAQLTLRLAPN
jgi:hypothetical protein